MLTALASLADVAAHQPAVSDARQTLSFGELFRRAGAVAARIAEIDPDGTAPVPVLVDQDVDSVVGLFGVLLAGRAFVPIELAEPRQRSSEILTRLGARVVVSVTSASRRQLPDHVETVLVTDLGERDVPPPAVLDRDLAAVVFTSGSTGRPKGVRLDHAVLACMTERARHDVTGPTVPGLARLSFQAGLTSLAEVSVGCHLKLRDLGQLAPMELVDWLDAERFVSVSLVPSVARAVLEHSGGRRRLPHARELHTYGEALRWSDVGPLRMLAPEALIIVSYGATEAGGGITELDIHRDDPLGAGVMPLGRATVGKVISLEPIDDGGEGPSQIVVRGAIAAGYWDDPTLEAERFGTDSRGNRFWRSGDLARYVDDELVHCGRVDDLVKIAGMLVEPAEVERVLLSMPEVTSAAVLGQAVAGHLRLVAHVQPTASDVDPMTLKAVLRERLPPHLVPSVFVRHDVMPVSIRGKVDRERLRAAPVHPWQTDHVGRASDRFAPGSEVERVIAGFVNTIVGFESELELGPDDDVFEAGLDSLGVIELLAALDDVELGSLSPRDVLECPTPTLLAERCHRPVHHSGPVVLNGRGRLPPIWIVAGGGATALAYRALADCFGPSQPVVIFEAAGLHDDREPFDTVEAEAEAHLSEVLRMREQRSAVAPDEPILLAGHSWGGLVAYEMAARLHDADAPFSLFLLDGGPQRDITLPQRLARLAREPRRLGPIARRYAFRVKQRSRVASGRQPAVPKNRYGMPRALYDPGYRRAVASGSRYDAPPASFSVTLGVSDGSTRADYWRHRVAQLTVVQLPGSHTSLLQPPNVRPVADIMQEAFERAAHTAVGSTSSPNR